VRIAVVYYSEKNDEKLKSIAQGLTRGFENSGSQSDIIDIRLDESKKLTGFDYIAVGVSVAGVFNTKLPKRVGEYLKNAGQLVGKRSFAFVTKKMFFSQKILSRLMKQMEGEGMFLKYSEVISTIEEAQEIAKRLNT
jgi:menaquinone-dependent protoporphyrinogen IX oxidase